MDGQPPTPNEVQARVAEFKHLVRTAQRGRLRDTEWDRVRRWPDLWELRWTWDDGTFVRGYFYEPLHWPAETVLALVHVKVILADPESTAARQNAEMDSAQRRVLRGEACTWGLPSSQPIVNLRHP